MQPVCGGLAAATGGFSQPVSASQPPTSPHAVPVLCHLPPWLNNLSFLLPFVLFSVSLLASAPHLTLSSGIRVLISHFNSPPSCVLFLHILFLFSSPWKIRPPSFPSWNATPMLMGLGLWLNHLSLVRSSKFGVILGSFSPQAFVPLPISLCCFPTAPFWLLLFQGLRDVFTTMVLDKEIP